MREKDKWPPIEIWRPIRHWLRIRDSRWIDDWVLTTGWRWNGHLKGSTFAVKIQSHFHLKGTFTRRVPFNDESRSNDEFAVDAETGICEIWQWIRTGRWVDDEFAFDSDWWRIGNWRWIGDWLWVDDESGRLHILPVLIHALWLAQRTEKFDLVCMTNGELWLKLVEHLWNQAWIVWTKGRVNS